MNFDVRVRITQGTSFQFEPVGVLKKLKKLASICFIAFRENTEDGNRETARETRKGVDSLTVDQ